MKTVFATLALVALAGTAFAQETEYPVQVKSHYAFGQAVQGPTFQGDAYYSNITNFSGSGFAPGGAANQLGNTITRMVMDDITTVGGGNCIQITFSVANFNAVNVNTRARIRFFNADGPGGGPGTYYAPGGVAVGYTFNPFSFAPGVTNLTGTLAAPGGIGFAVPAGTFWAGITFDNNSGTSGATLAQLNNMGVGIFDPPNIGSSTDNFFTSTAAGSFFNVPAPAGALNNFGGAPVANAGWEFVPTPGALALLGLGGLAASRRRR